MSNKTTFGVLAVPEAYPPRKTIEEAHRSIQEYFYNKSPETQWQMTVGIGEHDTIVLYLLESKKKLSVPLPDVWEGYKVHLSFVGKTIPASS